MEQKSKRQHAYLIWREIGCTTLTSRTSKQFCSHTGPVVPVVRIYTNIPCCDMWGELVSDDTVKVAVAMENLLIVNGHQYVVIDKLPDMHCSLLSEPTLYN